MAENSISKRLYAGTDLHARHHHPGILNVQDQRMFHMLSVKGFLPFNFFLNILEYS